MPLIQKDKANERSFKTLTWVWNYAIEDDLSLHKWPEVLRNSCLTNWCSQLKFSPCSSKYSIIRFRNASLLIVSVSQTTQTVSSYASNSTFIRLWSFKNQTSLLCAWYNHGASFSQPWKPPTVDTSMSFSISSLPLIILKHHINWGPGQR